MDTRLFLCTALVATVALAGCNRQQGQEQKPQTSPVSAVRGTQQPDAIVPASPQQGTDHGNSEAQKGGSPHSGTAQPPGEAGTAPPPGKARR